MSLLRASFYLAVPLAALVLLVAADNDKPTKLALKGINPTQTGFELQVSSQFGTATAGENATFQIETTLVVRDLSGSLLATLGPQADPVEKAGREPDDEGFIALQPQVFAWDRNGGTGPGAVEVMASSQLLSPSGAAIGGTVEADFTIEVGSGLSED